MKNKKNFSFTKMHQKKKRLRNGGHFIQGGWVNMAITPAGTKVGHFLNGMCLMFAIYRYNFDYSSDNQRHAEGRPN